MRQGGLASLDYGKSSFDKNHDVPLGGIVGGINTDIALSKTTLFAASANRLLSGEILLDQENGLRKEKINTTSYGNRTNEDEATSSYIGGAFDFRFFGVSYAQAHFKYLNEFRVGAPPDLSAHDERTDLSYTNLKVGTAVKLSYLRAGIYYLNQSGKGNLAYTFYDPTTGNQGSTYESPTSTSASGYGVGLGFTLPKARAEISYESISNQKVSFSEDYPVEITAPSDSSRISAVAEIKAWIFTLGLRLRNIQGNYRDLEDIISSSLLFDKLSGDDRRTETTVNVSLGDSKGFSPSAFYTQSEITTEELSPVFDNGLKYKAVTKSQAYGVSLSYRF